MRADETLYDLLEEIDGLRGQDRQAGVYSFSVQ
jgi:hypothetical protein